MYVPIIDNPRVGWDLIHYDCCPYKKRRDIETDTQREDGHMMTEAKSRVMLL